MYRIVFSRQAMKDRRLVAQARLETRAKTLLNRMAENPFCTPPPYEKLVGNLAGFYSRRLNSQHRLVYAVDTNRQEVRILSMWTHYEQLHN